MKRNVFALIMFIPSILLFAQTKDSLNKYWITSGCMFYNKTATGNISYSFSVGDNFYKVGYLVHNVSKYSWWNSGSIENADLNSIYVSIGKRFQSEWWQFAFFAGPSYVFGEKEYSDGITKKYSTIGLQTDMQILFRYADELGIGFGLWGNVNIKTSRIGININLTLGNGK